MKVLVVGGGGREHALVCGLACDASVDRILAAPGNAGIAREGAECEPVAADDVEAICALVEREAVDLTVVGPEAPLVAGLADALVARGRKVFGPSAAGARIEGSKAWTKDLCERYGIPTGASRTFSELGAALDYLDSLEAPYVVKADGLAAGKGVIIASDRAEAADALKMCLVERVFGEAGAQVLVEEFLSGPEVSAFALTDGQDVLPLVMAQDFKRIGDGGTGPNTGGMGAYSPVPFVDEEMASRIFGEVVTGAVRAMRSEGVLYRGVLFAGLMLTADGPKLLEFNCRFGDPETEVIVPRLRSDLGAMLLACAEGNLADVEAEWTPEACVTVVAASGGYPGKYGTGFEIEGLDAAKAVDGVTVFHSGTMERQGRVVTSGGRVLAVSGRGATTAEARDRAYEAASRVSFEGMYYRKDIAEGVA